MALNVLVTRKSNVSSLDDNDSGINGLALIDESEVGYLRKTHIIQATVQDRESGQVQIGALARAEVYWENKRSPAFTLEAPEDLVWLEMDSLETDSDENSEDDDEEDEMSIENSRPI